MTARHLFVALSLGAFALCGCQPTAELPLGPPAPTPPPTGSIDLTTTVNGLAQGCDVLGGGGKPQLLVDGAAPSRGIVDGAWVLVDVAPGLREVTARCVTCDGKALGEASTSVEVVAGEVSIAQLDVAGPIATGAVTVRWDASACMDVGAWVILDGGATCRDVDADCAAGEVTVPNVLPGTYSVTVGCADSRYSGTLAALLCGCSGRVFDVVVPAGPLEPGAVVAGPVTLLCGCAFLPPS